MTGGQEGEDGQQFQGAAAKHKRHAPQQRQRRQPSPVGRLGFSALGAGFGILVDRRAAVGRPAHQRQDRARHRAPHRPTHGEAQRQDNDESPRGVQQDVVRPRLGRHDVQPCPQQRHALDRAEGGGCLAGEVIEEAGRTNQHLGAEAPRSDRDGGLGRRGLRLRLCDGLQGADELVALLRVLQHLEGVASVVRTDLGVSVRRDGKQTGEDQQAQHHHGSGQQEARLVNKMAVRGRAPAPANRRGLGWGFVLAISPR